MSTKPKEPQFSKLRSALWPIMGSEMKKFLPMGLMMFFILFNYTILRDTKDMLVVGAAGAEAVSFLKGIGVMSASILFVVLYAKLSNVLSTERLFYTILTPFLLFFGAFAFVIYPNRDLIHPNPEVVEACKQAMPALRFIFALWGSWSFSVFYIMSELWGTVVIALLFWTFANEITRTNEAKRFYGLFPLLGNVALMFSGPLITYFCTIEHASGVDAGAAVGVSLDYMMSTVVIAGLAVMAIYWWMNRNVLTDPLYYDAAEASKKVKKDKPKMTVMESFKYILSQPYLGYIALLLVGYGMAINLVEVTWKGQLKLMCTHDGVYSGNEYGAFMGKFSFFTGLATIGLILMFKGVVRRFGWLTGAIFTPIALGVTGVLFYAFILFKDDLSWMTVTLGATPVVLAVMFGAVQNILSKGTKYALFDPTKEMAYIPLDQEMKVKGKAAVDVIGGRLGKAGGGWIQMFLLTMSTTATQITIAPYTCGIMVLVIFAWIFAAGRLNGLYQAKLHEKEKEAKKA